jgi:hypothetical protein
MIAPAKTPGKKDLEQQRDGEINALKERLNTLAETIQQDPADWIGKHPYLATGGAAAAGFLVAQLLGKSHHHHAAPPAPQAVPLKPKTEPDISQHLMELASAFAARYLSPGAPDGTLCEEEAVGTVSIADTGSATGAHFPGDFTQPPAMAK